VRSSKPESDEAVAVPGSSPDSWGTRSVVLPGVWGGRRERRDQVIVHRGQLGEVEVRQHLLDETRASVRRREQRPQQTHRRFLQQLSREALEPTFESFNLSVEHDGDGAFADERHQELRIIGPDEMLEGMEPLALNREPFARGWLELGLGPRPTSTAFRVEVGPEHDVIAIDAAATIDLLGEGMAAHEIVEDLGCVLASGELRGQLDGQRRTRAGGEEEGAHLLGLLGQDLGHQVIRNGLVVSAEVGEELFRISPGEQREHRDADPGCPALRVAMRQFDPCRGQVTARPGQQFADLVHVKGEVRSVVPAASSPTVDRRRAARSRPGSRTSAPCDALSTAASESAHGVRHGFPSPFGGERCGGRPSDRQVERRPACSAAKATSVRMPDRRTRTDAVRTPTVPAYRHPVCCLCHPDASISARRPCSPTSRRSGSSPW
jgi:hypothetical protein